MAFINYKNLSLPKLNSDINFWADHIEFLCFLSQEEYSSKQQIIDRILDENSNDSKLAINNIAEEDEVSDLVNELNDETLIAEDEIIDGSQNNPALIDKVSSKTQAIFNLLQSRETHYKEEYPFYVNGNEILLKDNLTVLQKAYLILLCSSLLRLATKFGINKIGHFFEHLCGPVFSQLLPNNSNTYFFGSGGSEDTIFKGTFYEKIIKLCNELHVTKGADFTPKYSGIHNVGDGGLDWVGIFNFPDAQSSQPVFFGQCACGTTDWIDKEFDTHYSKWKNYIQFKTGYLTYHFIPRNYRDDSLIWFNPLDIYDVVLIDRYRMIGLLKKIENLEEIISIYNPLFAELNENKIDDFM